MYSSQLIITRSPWLDCIRAVAILSVFAFHVAIGYKSDDLDAAAQFLQRAGFLGVDIFFPLSGFLITRILLAQSDISFIRTFFLRRLFRILPLYFISVILYFLASVLLNQNSDTIGRIWINILMLTGWFAFVDGKDTIPFLITWSISVEEFAYLLFGGIAFVFPRNLRGFIILMIGSSLILRCWILTVDSSLDMFKAVYYFPPARLDSIALGGLTAVYLQKGSPSPLLRFFISFLLLAALMSVSTLLYKTLIFSFISIGTCFLIALSEIHLSKWAPVSVRILANIGFYSYFNYLFHFFVIESFLLVVARFGLEKPNFWLTFVACLAVTQVLAILSFRFFEGPMIRMGRQLERHRN